MPRYLVRLTKAERRKDGEIVKALDTRLSTANRRRGGWKSTTRPNRAVG
jgi:hypothetical protein